MHSKTFYFQYPVLVFAALVFSLIRHLKFSRESAEIFLFYLVGLFVVSWEDSVGFNLKIIAFLLFLFCATCILFYLVREWASRDKILIALVYSIGIFNLSIFLSDGWTDLIVLKSLTLQRYMFIFYLIFIDQSLNYRERQKFFIKALAFPGQFLFPLPTQAYYWEREVQLEASNRVAGCFDLVICSIFSFFLFKLEIWYVHIQPLAPGWLLLALLQYLGVYFYSCVSITTAVAIARLLGYSMPRAFRLPLLAASPQERWRRWNTYFYNFYIWLIYVPVFKKTKSIFISVMVTFFITGLFHTVDGSPLNFISKIGPARLLNSNFVFFFAHGVAVYFGIKYKTRFWDGKMLSGWFGVALTWVIMLLIHAIKIGNWNA